MQIRNEKLGKIGKILVTKLKNCVSKYVVVLYLYQLIIR